MSGAYFAEKELNKQITETEQENSTLTLSLHSPLTF